MTLDLNALPVEEEPDGNQDQEHLLPAGHILDGSNHDEAPPPPGGINPDGPDQVVGAGNQEEALHLNMQPPEDLNMDVPPSGNKITRQSVNFMFFTKITSPCGVNADADQDVRADHVDVIFNEEVLDSTLCSVNSKNE
uniref:Uncharacterized protein n=1 Tax=Arundo donax TaxID=35708 RepID=A0A0A9CQQ0_ARUDO